ncbi:DUF6297 family protein [Actinomyces respiraculi]|uniref:DUF6297 family protein n=1 Tax=Actinomyces respiraculi TaxID=2744574 RepID=UPI0014247925|nr:DUF6297 family protein [Actinomyces respiraculi]
MSADGDARPHAVGTHPGGTHPGGDPDGGAPDLLVIARWTRQAQRRRRRFTRPLSHHLGNAYSIMLSILVLGTVVFHLLVDTGVDGMRGLPGLETEAALPLDTDYLVACALLVLGAVAVGALRRLGPVFLRPEQVAWWLALPGGRRRLLTRVLVRAVLTPTIVGAFGVGTLVTILLGGGVAGLLTWALLAAGTAVAAVTAAATSQITRTRALPARLALLVVATALLGVALIAGPGTPTVALGGLGVVLLVSATTALLLVTRGIETVPDAELAKTSRRAFGVGVATLSMDTREIGRLMAPEPLQPRRSARMPLARAGRRLTGRWGAAARTILGVAQADALLLARQPWRLVQVAVGAGLSALLLVPGMHWVANTAVMLAAAVLAALAVGDPARRAAFEGGPDASWPTSPRWVRAGHLVVPVACLMVWGAVLGAALTLAGAGQAGAAGWLLGAGLLAGVGWGGVAVRSAMRTAPDWSEFIATPIGPIPDGFLRSLSQGPDAAAIVAWPLVMVLLGAGAGPKLVLAQAVVSAFAVVLALWTAEGD